MAKPPSKQPLTAPQASGNVPGQLIVRFKQQVVQQLAASPLRRMATAREMAASIPDSVSGPLDFLKNEGGMRSVRPLFVDPKSTPKSQAGPMRLAAVRSSLATSATGTRESLRGFQIVELKQKRVTPALLKKLRASSAIELVEPVPNRWLCAAGADPLLNRQWGLTAIRWFQGKRPDAAAVHVAVLDSGVDGGHPDLKDAIEEYRHDKNKERDLLGHGTHVSGTIAATINNAVGIAGVANCRLHCWKIFDDPSADSDEQNFNFEFYTAALASALDSEVKVINLSIGGTEHTQTEAAIFSELRAAGVIVAAAMGNEFQKGNPKEYPAGYSGTLAVGAVDEVERRAPFSCTGDHIGLVAPGVSILSTVPREKASFAGTTDYDSWPGTSMATPHVAGCAALLYAGKKKSAASATEVVDVLTSTAKKLPDMKKKAFTKELGHGLIDLEAALQGS
jgi:subtilisin family serine protease